MSRPDRRAAPLPGTFNRRAGRGGANGSFRFEVALAPNSNNANLARANSLVNSWKASVDARLRADPKVPAGTRVSYADTLQAAGVLASIAAGGPTAEQLWKPFVVGRVDATRADADLNLLPGQNQRIAQLSCTYRERRAGRGVVAGTSSAACTRRARLAAVPGARGGHVANLPPTFRCGCPPPVSAEQSPRATRGASWWPSPARTPWASTAAAP